MPELLSVRTAGLLAALGFIGIALYQIALALGAPLGRAAWGGAHRVLPMPLRIASAVAVAIWLLAALVVTARAGVPILPLPTEMVRWGTLLVAGLSLLGAITNFASTSPWERYGWGPVALILAGLCLVVALNASEPAAGRSQADRPADGDAERAFLFRRLAESAGPQQQSSVVDNRVMGGRTTGRRSAAERVPVGPGRQLARPDR
jgi:hypothetical protein